MRILFTLVAALLMCCSSMAADMQILPKILGTPIKKNAQYVTDFRCEKNGNLSKNKARHYIERLDEDGVYNKNRRSPTFFFAKEVLHGFMILKDSPNIDKTKFLSGSFEAPQNSYFVPLFHIKRVGNRVSNRITVNRLYDNSLCAAKDTFLMGDNNYFIVPFFMYSDEGDDDTTFLSALLGTINDIANPLQVLLGDRVSDKLGNRASNLNTVIKKISEFVGKPKAKIVLENPIKFREGITRIVTEFTTVTIETNRDRSFLRGSGKFRDAFDDTFESLLTDTDYSSFDKIVTACRNNDESLKKAGLRDSGSNYDRAYILHRHMRKKFQNAEEILHCLIAAGSDISSVAVNPGLRNLFYKKGEKPFTQANVKFHIRKYSDLIPKDYSQKLDLDSVIRLKKRELADIHLAFTPNLTQSEKYEDMSRIAKRAEDIYFMPKISISEKVNGTVFAASTDGIKNGKLFDTPYNGFKILQNLKYDQTDCVIEKSDVTSEAIQDAIFGDSELGFLLIKSNSGSPQNYNDANADFARVSYADNGTDLVISEIEIITKVPNAVLENAECIYNTFKAEG